MFTRSLFQTDDMYKRGRILARAAAMVDDGVIKTTKTTVLNGLSVEVLKEAHAIFEKSTTIGKIVVNFDHR
jgi:NADPH:quinone reductase-like Zn-dependent oxidoreductase